MIAKRVRFLVLRGGAIGDFIVTLPALSALRERWGDAYIELIGYPHIAQLALDAGLVDRVDSLDRARIANFFSLIPSFTPEQVAHIRSFDLIVSYLHDPDGSVLNNLQLAGAKQVIYGSPIVEAGLHAVDHLLKPLEVLAIYESGSQPALRIRETHKQRGVDFLRQRGITGKPYAIHPGSGSTRKNWPLKHFLELAERIRAERGGVPFFLIGEADEGLADALGPHAYFRDLSLSEVASLLSACHAYVGNDSGITHLAASLGIPVTALFGPSSVEQWGPRGARVTILSAADSELSRIAPAEVLKCLPS
jgi:heptosyltransferase III